MNSQQFNILLNKLQKLQKQREQQQDPRQINQNVNNNEFVHNNNHAINNVNVNNNNNDKQKQSTSKNKKNNINIINNKQINPKYPHQISKYEIIQTLGAGTFGRVKLIFSPHKQVLALKQISKSHIINLKQILSQLHHPFIYSLKAAFQDQIFIYMIFQYCSGGELFNRLRKDGRDLKPENLLIDKEGHIKIADFGFAKKLNNDRTYTLCGTPEYLAPEIILGSKEGYGKSADWWALGILVYQLLTGHPPFYDMKPLGIYQKILKGIIQFPSFLSLRSKDLIRKLLNPDVKYRLGVNDNGQSIKQHKWFRGVDFEMVYNRQVPAPWVPYLRNQFDACWFDKIPDTPRNQNDPISQEEQLLFADF